MIRDGTGRDAVEQRVIRLEDLRGDDRVAWLVEAQAENPAGVVDTVLDANQVALVFVKAVDASGSGLRGTFEKLRGFGFQVETRDAVPSSDEQESAIARNRDAIWVRQRVRREEYFREGTPGRNADERTAVAGCRVDGAVGNNDHIVDEIGFALFHGILLQKLPVIQAIAEDSAHQAWLRRHLFGDNPELSALVVDP